MLIKIITLSVLWGALAGITHMFLSNMQKNPLPPAQYFFRLLLRYSILLGFAIALVKVLHGSVGFFIIGLGISILVLLVDSVRK